MASHREDIMAHLLTALRSINGPPTYTHTLGPDQVVTREPLGIIELERSQQLPAALLEEREQAVDPHFEQDSSFVPSALSMWVLQVTVLVLVEERSGVNTGLNAWMADIITAAMVDRTRGGAAIDTHFLGVSPPRENRVIPDGLAAAEMRFQVKYVSAANAL